MIPAGPHPLMMCGDGDPLDEYFKVGHSVRFNGADAPSLTWTPGVAGNSKTFTLNFDLKRTALDTNQTLFHAGGSTSAFKIYFNGADNLLWVDANNGSLTFAAKSLSLFRDLCGHANVTVAIDTTAATKEAGVRIEVDGRDVTSFSSSNWTQNADTWWNRSGVVHSIGRGMWTTGNVYSAEAIMSNIRQIDGQFLTSAAFRRVHPRTGQGRPIRYAGTYGTLGFWLDFEDGSAATAAALGKDRSGNNNDWTPTNLSVAAGAGCDWLEDTTTKNACTLNPMHQRGANTFANGNLDFTLASVSDNTVTGTFLFAKGKWYWEVTPTAMTGAAFGVGIVKTTAGAASMGVFSSGGVGYYGFNGNKFLNGVSTAYGATFAVNDVIGAAPDFDNNTIEFFKNGVSQGVFAIDPGATWLLACSNGTNTGPHTANINAGQRAFAFSPPAGHLAPNTKNLPIKPAGPMKSSSAFVEVTASGANIQSTLAAARAGWSNYIDIIKRYDSTAEGWRWIFSDDLAHHLDTSTPNAKAAVPAFSGSSYVGYSLKVSAANGVATGTFVHANGVASVISDGLSNVRKMIILHRESVGGGAFYVYHPDLTAGKLLYLNTMDGETTDASINTVTASGFTAAAALPSGTYRWISLAEVDGFSKAAKFNAQDAFSNLGLSAGLVLLKRIEATSDWFDWDIVRSPRNVISEDLYVQSSVGQNSSLIRVDIVSNGMKSRAASGNNPNVPGATYVTFNLAAFPFRYANAR